MGTSPTRKMSPIEVDVAAVTSLVTRFKNDDRILMWDIINEPRSPTGNDHYIKECFDLIRSLEAGDIEIPCHPITVGAHTGALGALQAAGAIGDFPTYHSYGDELDFIADPIRAYHQANYVKNNIARGGTVVLGEFGVSILVHSEEQQAEVFDVYLSRTAIVVAGAIPWCLCDYPEHSCEQEKFRGVLRCNSEYTPKAAAGVILRHFSSRWHEFHYRYTFAYVRNARLWAMDNREEPLDGLLNRASSEPTPRLETEIRGDVGAILSHLNESLNQMACVFANLKNARMLVEEGFDAPIPGHVNWARTNGIHATKAEIRSDAARVLAGL